MGRFDDLFNIDSPDNKLKALQQPETNIQKSRIPEIKNSRKPDTKKSRIPDIQKTRIPENQNIPKREFYQKVTYRISDEAVDALEDAKKLLKRKYKLKVNMEEIVETAIIEAYKNLLQKDHRSILVIKYSGNPENQNS